MFSTVRRTRPLATLLIAFVAVACSASGKGPEAPPRSTAVPTAPSKPAGTTTPAAAPVDPSSDAWLAVGRTGEAGLRVIRASTNEELIELPEGVPDATWGHLVTATSDGASTLVSDLVVQPGFGGYHQTVKGAWRLPTLGVDPMPVGVSADGSTIVLVEGKEPASANPVAISRFAILDRDLHHDPTFVELAGSFEYDTLSPDGSILYVVQHLPGPPEGHYQVRAVDRASGTLREGVVVDKSNLNEAMAGWPIAQAGRPDGMVFTLYRGTEHPFIHALSSIDSWALCIDLPATGQNDAAAAIDWGLTQTTAGGPIVAVNATLGLAVEIHPTDLAVQRSVSFAPSAATGIIVAKFGHQATGPVGRRVVAAPEGSVIYAAGPGGIVRIATADLAVTGRFLEGTGVDAIAVMPDGRTIYALLTAGGRIVKLDAETGAIVGEVPAAGFDRLAAIVPW
jgi:hypothetical protein